MNIRFQSALVIDRSKHPIHLAPNTSTPPSEHRIPNLLTPLTRQTHYPHNKNSILHRPQSQMEIPKPYGGGLTYGPYRLPTKPNIPIEKQNPTPSPTSYREPH